MALSCSRFFRFLRSIAEPTIVLVCFSTLLTFVFVLYQPSPGPGISQRVGWQSWDSVGGTPSQGGATQEPPPSDSDWWNVTSPQDDGSSYPLDTWTPLLPHDTGCTYVAPLWFIGDALTLVACSVGDRHHAVHGVCDYGRRPVCTRYHRRARRRQGQMGPRRT